MRRQWILSGVAWIAAPMAPGWSAQAVYLQVSGLGPMLGSGFWLIATDQFDPHTARHHFGRIAGVATLAGLGGALVAERVAAFFGVTMMLPVLAALNLFCAWQIHRLARLRPSRPSTRTTRTGAEKPTALAVPRREFELAVKNAGGNVIVALKLDGTAEQTAIIREVQRDPISHDIIHLDFHHISLTEKVTVEVAVHLVGIADGVKNGGGVLEHIARTVEIECLPTEIPANIEADVTALGIGDSIHVRDLVIPNATVLSDPDTTIATVVPPTKQVEEAPAAEVATGSEPEVIAKGKTDEAAAEKK